MKSRTKQLTFILGIIFNMLLISTSFAQDSTCTGFVQTALEAVSDVCTDVARNQVCYGNVHLEATSLDTVDDFAFEIPGDTENIVNIDTLQLSSLNLPDEWGIALMKIQANLPDTLPGQNVTMLLFGDVSIEEQASKLPDALQGTVTTAANIRRGPSTNYGLLGSVSAGTAVEVDARNEAGDWIRIYRADSADLAWVSAPLIEVEGDISSLTVVEVADPIASGQFGPMQSFVFRSGIGTNTCEEAPPDGILIQTPEGAGEINLLVNQVDIRLGSTAFLTAAPNNFLNITLLEGQGTVTSDGISVFVPAGLRARVPLGDDALPIGPPELVTYEFEELANLPISNLDETFELPEPRAVPVIVDAESAEALEAAEETAAYAGDWFIAAQGATSCSTGALLVPASPVTPLTITASGDSLTFFANTVSLTGDGVYEGVTVFSRGDVDYNTLTFTSPTSATWLNAIDLTNTDLFPCKEVVVTTYTLFR